MEKESVLKLMDPGDVIVCVPKGEERPYKEIVFAYIVNDNSVSTDNGGVIFDGGKEQPLRSYDKNFMDEINCGLNGFELHVYSELLDDSKYKQDLKLGEYHSYNGYEDAKQNLLDALIKKEIFDKNFKYRDDNFVINPFENVYCTSFDAEFPIENYKYSFAKNNDKIRDVDIIMLRDSLLDFLQKNTEYGNSEKFKVIDSFYQKGWNSDGSKYSDNEIVSVNIRPRDFEYTGSSSDLMVTICKSEKNNKIDMQFIMAEGKKDLGLLVDRMQRCIDWMHGFSAKVLSPEFKGEFNMIQEDYGKRIGIKEIVNVKDVSVDRNVKRERKWKNVRR